MIQPEGLQTDLAKCSRATRQWVMSLSDKIDELRKIVDRIPTTADGVPVLPGGVVWHVRRTVYGGVVISLDNDGHIETTAHGDAPAACYHHYAAARAALEKAE